MFRGSAPPHNEWQRRIDRAEELARQGAKAADLLRFYGPIARFQERFYRDLEGSRAVKEAGTDPKPFEGQLKAVPAGSFRAFLSVVEQSGPDKLREEAREWAARGEDSHLSMLAAFWAGEALAPGMDDFFARAFLQPFAVAIRTHVDQRWNGSTAYVCPFCKRKPCVGVLRPLGEGGQRSLICSFCLAEWEFRRLLCAGCGEQDPAKLPVYAAEELPHVRVDACDSCKSYIKTVDLTKSGLGEPVVDEIASVALDLWAQMRGYAKLQVNLLQL